MIPFAAVVVVQHVLHGGFDEVLIQKCIVGQQHVPRIVLQVVAEPGIQRNSEAHFFTILQAFRKMPGKCICQYGLGSVGLVHFCEPEFRRSFNDLVIEKRTAALESVGHAGDVYLGEQVAGQIRLQVSSHRRQAAIVQIRGVEQFADERPGLLLGKLILPFRVIEFVPEILRE